MLVLYQKSAVGAALVLLNCRLPKHGLVIKTDSAIAAGDNAPMLVVTMGRPLTSVTVQGMSDTVWKVGCYRINPSTPSGQKFFILHMLVLPLIPITALVIQNSVTMNTLLGYQSRVSTIRRQVHHQYKCKIMKTQK